MTFLEQRAMSLPSAANIALGGGGGGGGGDCNGRWQAPGSFEKQINLIFFRLGKERPEESRGMCIFGTAKQRLNSRL